MARRLGILPLHQAVAMAQDLRLMAEAHIHRTTRTQPRRGTLMSDTKQSQPDVRSAYKLVSRPDDITHLVCCRDASWRVAFCGAEDADVNPAAEVVCSMCLEEAQARQPRFGTEERLICPIDGTPCPDEADIDRRILLETT